MKNYLLLLVLLVISVQLISDVTAFYTASMHGPYYLQPCSTLLAVEIPMNGILNPTTQRIRITDAPSWIHAIPYSCSRIEDTYYYEIIIQIDINNVAQNGIIQNRSASFVVSLQNIEGNVWYNVPGVFHNDSVLQYGVSQANSLQTDINNAPNNSVIHLPSGTYSGTINISSRTGLTIVGATGGTNNTSLIGVGFQPVFDISSSNGITLRNIDISNGGGHEGAGLKISNSTILIDNCTIYNNAAHHYYTGGSLPEQSKGATIHSTDSNVVINKTLFHSNYADLASTAYMLRGTVTFKSTTIEQLGTNLSVYSDDMFDHYYINSIISYPNPQYAHYDVCCLHNTNLLLSQFSQSNSFIDDPQYVSPANGDYSLQKGSPCIGTGYSELYYDYQGDDWNQDNITVHDETLDIGAIPYDYDRWAYYVYDNDPQGNWMCFPVIDNESYVSIDNTSYRADNMRAFFYDYEGAFSAMERASFRWYCPADQFGGYTHYPNNVISWHYMHGVNADKGFLGYKVVFIDSTNTDRFHGYHVRPDTWVEIPEHSVENWIGYFLPETQTPHAAFGSYLDELYYIQHKDWTMARTMIKRGAPWLTIGGTVTLSHGDMVIVKRFAPPSIGEFQWSRGLQTQKYIREIPEYFEFAKEPEYTAVFVQLDPLSTAKEIAIMNNEQCYGAAVVNGETVMIPAFIASLPEGSELEIIAWDGAKSNTSTIPINLFDPNKETYIQGNSFVKDSSDYYLIKTGTTIQDTDMPPAHALSIQNYPNPFNPSATISYSVPTDGEVSLYIYNVRGQLVNTLVSEHQTKGNYQVVWTGKDSSGNSVASGLYFSRLVSGGKSISNKMLLMK